MEVHKFKGNKGIYFFFVLKRNRFVISENIFCSVDYNVDNNIHLEEYELLFDEDINESLKNLSYIKKSCDKCIKLKTCVQKYKFLEEKEETFNYLQKLKETKRIGEFAEE